jgi:SRSO17 transposase
VSLSIANHHASPPVAYRLYLPREWIKDRARRGKTGVPDEIDFKTKPQIALEQVRAACAAGIPRGVALMDPGYGNHASLRLGVTALGLTYVAGIQSNTLVWKPGAGPPPGRTQPPKRGRRGEPNLMSAKEVALALPAKASRKIKRREGSAGWLSSRFARVRLRAVPPHELSEGPAEEWLLIEWPKDEKEPTKYWLSTLPEDISLRRLVDFAKLRWRIERDYQELKQEVGLGHFEGRGWRGFHHHATLCIAAYGFLISERETIPPSGPRPARLFPQLAVPRNHRPRGAAAAHTTPHPQLNRDHAPATDRGARQNPQTMSLLRRPNQRKFTAQELITQ